MPVGAWTPARSPGGSGRCTGRSRCRGRAAVRCRGRAAVRCWGRVAVPGRGRAAVRAGAADAGPRAARRGAEARPRPAGAAAGSCPSPTWRPRRAGPGSPARTKAWRGAGRPVCRAAGVRVRRRGSCGRPGPWPVCSAGAPESMAWGPGAPGCGRGGAAPPEAGGAASTPGAVLGGGGGVARTARGVTGPRSDGGGVPVGTGEGGGRPGRVRTPRRGREGARRGPGRTGWRCPGVGRAVWRLGCGVCAR